MPEQIYFADTAVKITSVEATFGLRSYAVADITAVRYSIDPASKTRAWYAFTYASTGALLLAIVLASINVVLLFMSYSNNSIQSLPAIGVPLLLISYSLLLAARESFVRVRYLVSASGSFGTTYVVLARNEVYARKVTRALKRAIKDQGKRRKGLTLST